MLLLLYMQFGKYPHKSLARKLWGYFPEEIKFTDGFLVSKKDINKKAKADLQYAEKRNHWPTNNLEDIARAHP